MSKFFKEMVHKIAGIEINRIGIEINNIRMYIDSNWFIYTAMLFKYKYTFRKYVQLIGKTFCKKKKKTV